MGVEQWQISLPVFVSVFSSGCVEWNLRGSFNWPARRGEVNNDSKSPGQSSPRISKGGNSLGFIHVGRIRPDYLFLTVQRQGISVYLRKVVQ